MADFLLVLAYTSKRIFWKSCCDTCAHQISYIYVKRTAGATSLKFLRGRYWAIFSHPITRPIKYLISFIFVCFSCEPLKLWISSHVEASCTELRGTCVHWFLHELQSLACQANDFSLLNKDPTKTIIISLTEFDDSILSFIVFQWNRIVMESYIENIFNVSIVNSPRTCLRPVAPAPSSSRDLKHKQQNMMRTNWLHTSTAGCFCSCGLTHWTSSLWPVSNTLKG